MQASERGTKRRPDKQITDVDQGSDSEDNEEVEPGVGFYDKKWEKADANTIANRK